MTLEYDKAKNRANIKKHHISIPELATIFDNPFTAPTMDVPDVMYSSTSIEKTIRGCITIRNGKYRLFTAREATKEEKRVYVEHLEEEYWDCE